MLQEFRNGSTVRLGTVDAIVESSHQEALQSQDVGQEAQCAQQVLVSDELSKESAGVVQVCVKMGVDQLRKCFHGNAIAEAPQEVADVNFSKLRLFGVCFFGVKNAQKRISI